MLPAVPPSMTCAANFQTPESDWELNTSSFMAFNGPFSLGMWVRFEGTYAMLLQNDAFFIAVVDGYVGMESTSLEAPLISQTCLTPDEWYYISVSTDGATVSLYINGDLENTMGVASAFPPGSVPLTIGGAIAQQESFQIWNLVLYTEARTGDQEQVAPWIDVALEPSLVAHVDFSQAPAVELVANHPVTGSANAAQATIAPCTTFDGTSGVVQIGNGTSGIGTTPTYTISVWVNVAGVVPGLQYVFSSASNPSQAITFYIDNQQPTFAVGGVIVWSPQPTVQTNAWSNYTFVMDAGGSLTVFINGDEEGEYSGFPNVPLTPPPWTLGATGDNPPQNFLNGAVQWLSVWSRALSPGEVLQQLYDSVSDDPTILADAAFDAFPSKDLGISFLPITFSGGSSHSDLTSQVTQWIAPPAQLNPGVMPTNVGYDRQVPAQRHAAASTAEGIAMPSVDDLVSQGLQSFEPLLANLLPPMAAHYRQSFEQKSRQAYSYYAENPSAAKICEWRQEGDERVFYSLTGDLDRELFRCGSAEMTDCQAWWLSFIFTLVIGLLGLYMIACDESALTQWINNTILNSDAHMEELSRLFTTEPVMTGAKILTVLGFIYSLGQVKRLLWTVAYMMGWWGLGCFLVYLLGLLVTTSVAVASFVVKAALLVAQLTVHYYGAPNVPGYQQSCGSGSCKREAAPA